VDAKDRAIVKRAILREVERQTVVEMRVLRLRLVYYYNLYSRLSDTGLLWIKLYDEILRLKKVGDLRSFRRPGQKYWYYLPSVPRRTVQEIATEKSAVFEQWNRAAHNFGHPFEEMIRECFRQAGHSLFHKATRPEFTFQGQRVQPEIDVHVLSPHHLYGTAKNILSEVILPPSMIDERRHSSTIGAVHRDFQIAYENDLTPILFAPRVDPGFARYAREHGGLFCQTLFQYFYCPNLNSSKARKAVRVAQEVRDTFRFGHVKVVDSPPGNIVAWIRRIPAMLAE